MKGTVLMMAGGTGGHVFPALAVAAQLQNRGYGVEWLGAEGGIENRLVPAAGLTLHRLAVKGVRGNGLVRKALAPLMLSRAIFHAWLLMRQVKPKLAVGFGGFASGPGGLAARFAGVPLLVHEQNAVAGVTNRVLARIASRVLQAFPGALGDKAVTLGNPVRADIVALPAPQQRYAERQGPIRVLVIGGSQGALALNRELPAALAALAREMPLLVRHQCGRNRVEEAQSRYQEVQLEAQVDEFIEDMASAYAWADLLICRAGALTVAEVAAAGVAALFIPLPTAVDDHQTRNAAWLADNHAAWVLPQQSLNADKLVALLGHQDRASLMKIASQARAMAITDSASRVADICEEVLHG